MPTTWRENSDKTWTPVIDKVTPLALLPPPASGTATAGVSSVAAREDHDHGAAAAAHAHTEVVPVVFSQPGAVTVSESGRYYPSQNETLKKVSLAVGTVGSSSSVLSVKRNGVSLDTITLVASDQFESKAFNQLFTADTDYLTMEFTSAGTSAAKPVIVARMEATL